MKNAILILLLATPFCLQSQSTPKNNPGQEEAGRPGCGREQGRKHCPPAFFTEQGQVYILAGIGLLPTYIADKPRTDIPPIHLGIRWMATKNFSLGAQGVIGESGGRVSGDL